MIDLTTQINGLSIAFPVFNASGVWCTQKKELVELGKSEAGAIVFKSMTVKKRDGNPEPRFFYKDEYSVNSMGLPNFGVDYYTKVSFSLKKFNKPLIASIAGFKEDEFYFLMEKVNQGAFDGIEVNLSCPNLEGKGIFAYNLKKALKILKNLREKTKKLLGVKLPPYFDRGEIKVIAQELVRLKIDFVTLINSYPLGCIVDYQKESMMIKPNLGIGGLGGKVLKPIALAQVVLFSQFSKNRLSIIGVGGVEKGSDIYEYLLAGAKAVGVGTGLLKEGPKIFSRLKKELTAILKEKKVDQLSKKIGQLKFLD